MPVSLFNISPLGKTKRENACIRQFRLGVTTKVTQLLLYYRSVERRKALLRKNTAQVNSRHLHTLKNRCLSVFLSLVIRRNAMSSAIFRVICKCLCALM